MGRNGFVEWRIFINHNSLYQEKGREERRFWMGCCMAGTDGFRFGDGKEGWMDCMHGLLMNLHEVG